MNKFDEFNYYEILELPVSASSFEIRRAYRNALEVYNDNSLLTYSLFNAEERVNIFKKLEDAYNTLIDRTKRTAYDATLSDKSSDTNIQQDYKLLTPGHIVRRRMDFISDAKGACPKDGAASETGVIAQSISPETSAERPLISQDRGSQKCLHEKSLELVDFRLTKSFWGQVSSRMFFTISLLSVTLIGLSAILGQLDLPAKYFSHLSQDESHLEATAARAKVEETYLGDQKDKVKEKPENLGNKTLITPESISSPEALPEVYENTATLANIRARPAIESRIITKIANGEKINVIGKDGEWTMLKLDDDSIGWIHGSLIRKRPADIDSSEVAP